MALFEGYERRIDQITPVLEQYGIGSIEECADICKEKGVDVYEIVKEIQPLAFENAMWAYTVGAAIAIKKGQTVASDVAETIGEGLQAFCIPGSVADDRKVGIGHGNLASMLLKEETKCFALLAGHESFAAAEGALGICRYANKARTEPLRVILNGLGKDAAQIISRINGFTHVATEFDYTTGELNITKEKPTPKVSARKFAATVRTMFVKAWPSCIRKALMFPLPETPPTRPASSIRSPAPTKKSVLNSVKPTSPSLPAAEPVVRCIPTTWAQVRLPTA